MNPVRRNPYRPKVPDLVPLIEAVYAHPDGGAGHCLHVVTDDANYDCASLVLEYAEKAACTLCLPAARMMAQMTESQIARASEMARR